MFAGAQLGVTVSSILLGRIGEPAVADLLRRPFGLLGASPALLHTASLLVALGIVVTLHLLLGEIVPKNIAMAGPERAAMLLIPVYLVYARACAARRQFLQPLQQRHLAGACGFVPATNSTSPSPPSSSAR